MTEFILSYVEMIMNQYKFSSCADMFCSNYHISLADCEGWNSNSAWELAESATSFVKTVRCESTYFGGWAEFRQFIDGSVMVTVIENGNIDEFINDDAYEMWSNVVNEYCDVEEYDSWSKAKHESNSPNHLNFLGKFAGLNSKQIRECKRSNWKAIRNPHGTKKNHRRI